MRLVLLFLYVFYGPNKLRNIFSYVFYFHVITVSKKYNTHTKIKGRKVAQKSKAYIYVLNTSWVKIDFVKDRCCGGKWRVDPLNSGELKKKG